MHPYLASSLQPGTVASSHPSSDAHRRSLLFSSCTTDISPCYHLPALCHEQSSPLLFLMFIVAQVRSNHLSISIQHTFTTTPPLLGDALQWIGCSIKHGGQIHEYARLTPCPSSAAARPSPSTVTCRHSLKNRTGIRIGEVIGLGFHLSDRRFISSFATKNRNV